MIKNEEQMCELIEKYFQLGKQVREIHKEERDSLLLLTNSLLSQDTEDELKSKLLTLQYRLCFSEDITLEEVWQIYWNLQSNLFKFSSLCLLEGSIRSLYEYIVTAISPILSGEYEYRPIKERNHDLILITTSQFLSVNHAPTQRVLDYSYTLQKDLGKRVVILNDGGMHLVQSETMEGSARFNFADQYNSIQNIKYKDATIEFFQNPISMPNVDAMKCMTDIIYNLNPLLVYNIGGSSLITDCCSKFTTTASLPCSLDLPISCSRYLLVGRALEERDYVQLSQMKKYGQIIETNINYQYRQNDIRYTREQFDILSDDFLICVVGNRIESELNDEFIELVNKVTKIGEKVRIAFVGNIINPSELLSRLEKPEQILLTGSLKEAGEFMRISDLYLNPKRAGGGRSSFESLYVGTPVETLAFGDVSYTCNPEFCHQDFNQVYEDVLQCYHNRTYLEEKITQAKKRAADLEDIKGTLQKAIDEIMKKEKEYEYEQ